SFFVGYQLVNTISQLAIGAAYGLRDVHFSVFVERAPVEYKQLAAIFHQARQVTRRDTGRMTVEFDQFAKGLGRYVHTRKQDIACFRPATRATSNNVYVVI